MQTLGYVTAVTLAAGAAAVGVFVVISMSDLRRYVRIRRM
jgi:hypothetical protein